MTTGEEVKEFGGWIVATITGFAFAIRWWYNLRKLDRVDKEDVELSRSVRWIVTELRSELSRVREDNAELRKTVVLQSARIMHLEEAAKSAGLPV